MARSHTEIYIMFVFVVKYRLSLLNKDVEDELFPLIKEIILKRGHNFIAVNGYFDHLHILIRMRPSQSISYLARDIKSITSKYINEKKWFKKPFR